MKKQVLNQILIWSGAVLALAVIFVFMYYFVWLGGNQSKAGEYQIQLTKADWQLGNPNAKVVLVEYSDFQCPACAYYSSLLKQLLEEYSDEVLFVYRHFPLSNIHKNANLSAYAAEAAGRQGQFWGMSEKLFLNQEDWAESNQAKEIFVSYAEELGLDQSRFLADLDSEEIKDKVFQDYQSALLYRLNGTPSFFINGKKIQNPRTLEEFRKIIEQELTSSF
ncbi:MAG: thioredoxin domain-containing protein [Patescibacteria group bacterium]